MPQIEVRPVADPDERPFADVRDVDESVGWTVYTRDQERLRTALVGSSPSRSPWWARR
jgi:hypothetical protein